MSKTLEEIHKIAFDYAIKNKQRFSSEGNFLISLHSNLEGYEACQKEYEEKNRWIPITKEFPYGECLLQNDKGKNSYFDFTGANDSDIQFYLVENCTEKWRPLFF